MPALSVATPLGDAGTGRLAVYLQPGNLYVASTATTITTILASCVAVCLFDQTRRVGGMNHFLLPHALAADSAPARFGSSATEILIEKLLAIGCRMRDLQAKVFGGAAVIAALADRGERVPLGESNVRCAFEILAQSNIPVIASDVGGKRGRKIIFHTDDGSALMKWL